MTNLLITKIKKWDWDSILLIILLLFIAIISHWDWFCFGNILSSGDTTFRSLSTLKDLYLTNTWIENVGFGTPEIQLYRLIFISIWSLGGNIGLQFTDVLKITHLIPIAVLGFISPYVLIKRLTKENVIAFTGAMFYGSTTPFIMRSYMGHLSIAFIIALTPLILYFFMLALEKNTKQKWLIFILIYWISFCYEPRIMYIVTIILGIYFLFFSVTSLKKYISKIILGGVLFIILSAFWILPLISGSFSEEINSVAGRDLFANKHYSIPQSFALFQPYWTEAEPSIFILQPILWYFWIIPMITVFFFLFRLKKNNEKVKVFFGIIWLIGLFLTKQAGPPFSDAFQWLRENIPGFLAFRSGSKFWFMLSLGYMGLLSFGMLWLKNRRKRLFFVVAAVIIIILSFWNLKPLILGNFGGMFTERKISNDYIILSEYLEEQKNFFRTFWVPANSRWGIYTNQKPKASDVAVIEDNWKDFITVYEQDGKKLPIQKKITSSLKQPFSNQLFDVSSIKYAIIPIRDVRNDDNFYVSYGEENNPNIRDWYISELDGIDWLKKIDIGAEELVVYENENYRPHIYITKEKETIYWEVPFERVDFVQKNPTEYEVNLKNIKRTTYLNFSESFHPDWKLRAGEFNWFNVLTDPLLKRSFRKDRIDYFLPDDFHFENNANLNTFKVDPDFIKENYPGSYTENSDGSINVDLTLYFKPQSYFYLGLIISSTTLIGCLVYLLYAFLKPRKEKTNLS